MPSRTRPASTPPSWSVASLGDVMAIESNLVAPNDYLDHPHVAPDNIESQTGVLLKYNTIRQDKVISPKHLFLPGHIIYSKIRPYLAKAVIVDFTGLCSADMYPIRSFVETKYLHRWLISKDFTSLVTEHQGRTVLPKINQEALLPLPLPIPPHNEQRRIVAKLDTLLERCRRTGELLADALALVSTYRRHVLTSAFSGALTAEWRKDIASSWSEVLLRELSSGFEYGTSSKSHPTGRVPVLRMGNLQAGKIVWEDLAYTSDLAEITKYQLLPKTVLFNRTNSPALVGKTAIYDGERPAIFAGYLIRINLLNAIMPEYINYYMNSQRAKDYFWSVKTDGVSQSNVNAQKLGCLPVPICSLPEQQELVRRIEALFAKADAIENQVQEAQAQLKMFEQAILAKAFRGELAPQDPNDEPASVLLDRIRAGRAASSEKGTGKRSRSSKSTEAAG